MKIAILTSQNQWFIPFAQKLQTKIKRSKLFFDHKDIYDNFDLVFILSYHQIIEQTYLEKHKHNIVVHASALPQGKGWAPMFWQILEGKNEIPFTMFEASNGVDNGDIYMQKTLKLTGYELGDELRQKQADFTIGMCLEFIENYEKYKTPKTQNGKESFYPKRGSKDSKLNIEKSIKEQFNLLRIADNENYPAFFEIEGNRYILKITVDERGGVELIDFVDLSLDEKAEILKWRNHESVTKWMYTQKEIELKKHLDFINSLMGNCMKHYLLVRKDGKKIGVIDSTSIDFEKSECDFGLYANPFEKVAGVGSLLLEVCIKYAFEILKLTKLKLEVFADNEKALNLYQKYGFKEIDTKTIDERDVVCMKLTKNRLKFT